MINENNTTILFCMYGALLDLRLAKYLIVITRFCSCEWASLLSDQYVSVFEWNLDELQIDTELH